jgi:WD40 repeat protein
MVLTGKMAPFQRAFKGHTGWVQCLAVSPFVRLPLRHCVVASGGYDRVVNVWDGECLLIIIIVITIVIIIIIIIIIITFREAAASALCGGLGGL